MRLPRDFELDREPDFPVDGVAFPVDGVAACFAGGAAEAGVG